MSPRSNIPARIVILVLAAALCLPMPGRAQEKAASVEAPPADAGAPTADPIVKISPPPSHAAREVLLFPLKIPSFVLRAATLPFGMLSRLIERKHLVERVTDALSNKDKTFWAYPIIEGGAGSGFGGGAGLTHINLFNDGYNAKLYYKNHINFDQVAHVTFGKPEAFRLMDAPASWAAVTHWLRFTGENYYGIGPSTTQANASAYLINHTVVGGGIDWDILHPFSINVGVSYDVGTTGQNTHGSAPPIDQVFPLQSIPGYADWLHYIACGLKFQYDSRDNDSLPERGGLYAATVKRFQHVGEGEFDYNQYELDARHFFRLGRSRQVLALHGGGIFQQKTGGGQIPFYRLATLDVYSPLRGFVRGRFHDRNLLIFNAEYRFPVWSDIDGVLFVDTGRVFHSFPDLTFNDFRYSAGGGLRIRALGIMLLRFDMAYGGEGIKTLLGISKSL